MRFLLIAILILNGLTANAQNQIVRRQGTKDDSEPHVAKKPTESKNNDIGSGKNLQKDTKEEPMTTEKLCLNSLNGDKYAQMVLNYIFFKLGPSDDEVWKQIFLCYSSKQDNGWALSVLSWCYGLGKGVDKNDEKSLSYAKKAANVNDPWGWASLAFCYDCGKACVKDEKQAFTYYKQAADAGVPMAQYAVGNFYRTGYGVQKDEKESIRYYELAAQQGHPTAKFMLGLHYEQCFNYKAAFELYKESANMWDVWGMCYLGKAYLNGTGTSVDITQAISWLQKAVIAGDPEALCILGDCYFAGKGVPRDQEKSFRMYKDAAEGGWISAYYNLGAMYYFGYGTSKNNDEALKWLLLAFNNNLGNGEIEYTIAKIYQEKGDSLSAITFAEAATFKNYQDAYLLLANLFLLNGSKERAIEALNGAIKKGVPGSQELLNSIK